MHIYIWVCDCPSPLTIRLQWFPRVETIVEVEFLSVWHFVSVSCLVYQFIGFWKWFEFKHAVITTAQFIKIIIKKVSNNKPFVRTHLVKYKSHNTNSIPKKLTKNDVHPSHHTWNIQIIRLRANNSRRIDRSSGWYRWPPLSLQSLTISYGDCRVRMHPVEWMRRIVLAVVCSESCKLTETVEEKRFYWHTRVTQCDREGRERAVLKKTESLTQRCVCMGCQIKSDQTLRLLCFKGHVRARDSTLFKHHLTRSEWILVY